MNHYHHHHHRPTTNRKLYEHSYTHALEQSLSSSSSSSSSSEKMIISNEPKNEMNDLHETTKKKLFHVYNHQNLLFVLYNWIIFLMMNIENHHLYLYVHMKCFCTCFDWHSNELNWIDEVCQLSKWKPTINEEK